ncbi:hypothetical protein AZI86_16235 [Bdellovibrio bacteriovorus]|uniref:Uncharacterized protein n=1 Tax=Bdellovibrio bacteriovorus TaxID=959 RepID=A0A150WH33_BDEBC|nr:hypothetical protein [Bdellovibrio bacteriovorus]KYG62385.1 hypothetical protein AZI86_16235 [Bdellovibrio bacteriovorus]
MKNIIESTTGVVHVFLAKKDGTECPFVPLTEDTLFARDFFAYAGMAQDFDSAKELFIESQNYLESPTIYGSLVSQGILAYCRPFKPGNSRSIRKLNPDDIFKEPAVKDVHNEIQVFRDKLYAHADKSPYRAILLNIALEPNSSSKAVLDIYRGMTMTIGLEPALVNNFVYTTNIAIDWINTTLDSEHLKLREHISKMDLESLYRDAIDPTTFDHSVVKHFLDYPWAK